MALGQKLGHKGFNLYKFFDVSYHYRTQLSYDIKKLV